MFRATREEWRGYALTAGRDALLRVLRQPGSDAVELYATEGASEWSLVWRGDIVAGTLNLAKLEPPLPIEDAVYRELERIVRRFISDWIWFASERREDIAVETERYGRHGYAVFGANVRTSRLHRMLADAGEKRPVAYTTLGADERWVKDLILATWAAAGEA